LLAHCSWQSDPQTHPTLLVVHGLEGSSDSPYMIGTADKAIAAGFNVIRLNLRNCGETFHLTPTIYHAGLTDDLRQLVAELSNNDGLNELYLAGFSLGGNMVLKLAGEYSGSVPKALRGVIAISPSIHLASCADAIELKSNLFYHMRFMLSLRRSIKRKAQLYPERYDASRLRGIWTIREFDNQYTAPHSGFKDVSDYYDRASSLPFIKDIQLPTLIIQAKDDPFIPFHPFGGVEIANNPNVALLATAHGGHVGFVESRLRGEDRFWAERKVVEFVELYRRDLQTTTT
jgi:predicted alpha/beta-fold hydrolase